MLKSDEPTVAAELEQLGSDEVRRRLARGEYGDIGSDLQLFVDRWLSSKDAINKASSERRAERRSEESLSISQRALFNSRCATIIATLAMIAAMSDKITAFLRWLGVLKP
jgi:hypothetical protein